MIQLTRLNGHTMAVNSDLIKFIEQAPDTVITLITGEKVVVKEHAAEVISRILEFRRAVMTAAVTGPTGTSPDSNKELESMK
ncbi:MAG TPA: flagellar FlbD family protein [Terriglobales bacterium]|nr:flagellar FlbD family protein [Terriglobales bacterium]